MKERRREAATSNRTYDPEEDRRGVLVALVLIAALAVLSALLFAAAPGDPARQPSQRSSGDGGVGPESSGTAPTQKDSSFPCDTTGYPDVELSVAEQDRLQEATERFVLSAYGDPGSDPADYERKLKKLIVPECFWQSEAGGYAESVEEVARAGQTAPASSRVFAKDLAVFDFQRATRVTDPDSGTKYVKAEVVAVWVSRKAGGELVGKQELLRLAREMRSGGNWRVVGGLTLLSDTSVYPEYQHAVSVKAEEINSKANGNQ